MMDGRLGSARGQDRRFGFGAALVAVLVWGAPAARADGTAPDSAAPPAAEEEHEAGSPEAVWDGFVEWLRGTGRGDLLPVEAPAGDSAFGGEAQDVHVPLPDLSRGDPILGILFRISSELVRLDAHFTDPELALRDGRDAAVRELIATLREHESPYIREYAEYYAARHALEGGEDSAARDALEKLVGSDGFLPRPRARKELAAVYRRQGEDTLAVLELQFLLAELSPQATLDREWVETELSEIRKTHKGPLHDCADRTRQIATRIAATAVGEDTQGKQREVEDILTKIAKLLEDQANRCPTCQQKVSAKTGQCKSSCQKCGACKAGSQACQAGTCSGSGQKVAQANGSRPGDPKGNTPDHNPADETKLQQGEAGDVKLRDADGRELWEVKINDRDVALALRELWSRMPPRYRELVKSYYNDINEIEPPRNEERK